MSEITVTEKVVLFTPESINTTASPDETAAGVVYRPGTTLTHPDLIHQEIEDHDNRVKIPVDDGWVSITVKAGARLGDIVVNVQFEGKSGDYDFSVTGHNALLVDVSQCLSEILQPLGVPFEARIESQPCPKTGLRVQVALTERVLIGHAGAVQARSEIEHTEGHRHGHVEQHQNQVTNQG